MFKRLTLPLGLALLMLAGTALAADPSAAQIYQAAQNGNLAQAQQMIQQVLKDHPNSAKAHFIAAELDARAQNFGEARQELAQARALKPGLPFASQHAVRELQGELGMAPASIGRPGSPLTQQAVHHRSHIGAGVLLIIGIIIVWMILRRRMAAARYGGYPGQMPGQMPGAMPPGGPGGYPPPGYGPGYGQGVGPGYGQGPGIMSSLGTGLAVGAGVVAGEELVGHMLNRGTGAGGVIPDAGAAQPDPQVNSDMGGNDFGVSDPGSWDDGSGGGGGDGGWT